MALKRDEALQPLSREHHEGLLLCWIISSGLSKRVEVSRIKAYTDWFFENKLAPHFKLEEEFIFPLLGNEDELVKRALEDHKRLRLLFEDTTDIVNSLKQIDEELEKHIRFEERVLFEEIQKRLSAEELAAVGKNIPEDKVIQNWKDEFWIAKA